MLTAEFARLAENSERAAKLRSPRRVYPASSGSNSQFADASAYRLRTASCELSSDDPESQTAVLMTEILFRAWSVACIATLACDRTLEGFFRSLLLLLSVSLLPPKLAELPVISQRTPRR